MTSVTTQKFRFPKLLGVLLPAVAIGGSLALDRETGGALALLAAQVASTTALWWLAGSLFALLSIRTGLWLAYRPTRAAGDSPLPVVTVVIPAFNEGATVRRAIESVAQADYPADRVELFCIDDGSTDDTFEHAHAACLESGLDARALRLDANTGKRGASFEGLDRARGDVIVTLDSDSELEPGALRALVAPFADARVGAVAGRVLVRNRASNLLTRMLWVQYVIGFDFTRAYQSMLGTVFCAPGACAAYRKSAVEDLLRAWRDQRFLGARCTNGDDHHLTNLVLRGGYRTVYQSTASVWTEVPETYGRLCRMYTRWARSNIRESFVYVTFGLSRARSVSGLFALVDASFRVAENAARPVAFAVVAALVVTNPVALLGALAATSIGGALYAAYYLRFELSTEALYGILYAYYSFLTLQWIYGYAFITVQRNGWLTR